MWAQGDILITPVGKKDDGREGTLEKRDPDGAIVLARGEVTGHRHAIYGSPHVTLFKDDALVREVGVPSDLNIGFLRVTGSAADIQHEEHDTIRLEPGLYEVRRQQEFPLSKSKRIVAD